MRTAYMDPAELENDPHVLRRSASRKIFAWHPVNLTSGRSTWCSHYYVEVVTYETDAMVHTVVNRYTPEEMTMKRLTCT